MNMFPTNRLSNVHGKTLRASSFDHLPYIYIEEQDSLTGKITYGGFEV